MSPETSQCVYRLQPATHQSNILGLSEEWSKALFRYIVQLLNQIAMANHQGQYSQHFIFFVTYKCLQYVRVLHYAILEMLATDKHCSLSEPFISYEGNEVLRKCPQRQASVFIDFSQLHTSLTFLVYLKSGAKHCSDILCNC